jgi:hypothetical protein
VRDRGRGDAKGDEGQRRHRDIEKREKAAIEETVRQLAKRNEIERDWERGRQRGRVK